MNSPAHPGTEMEQHELEPGLLVWRCPDSKGFWIPAPAYWLWHAQQEDEPSEAQSTPELPKDKNTPISNVDRAAMLCPESNCLLIRYHVGGGLGFYIDRSPITGGIWLDDGEWQALKTKGIHSSLHMIFNSSYQKKVRIEEAQKSLSDHFFNELTPDDQWRVKEFNSWLLGKRNRRRIAAWLQQQIERDE